MAALLAGRILESEGGPVVAVLSGGNVDMERVTKLVAAEASAWPTGASGPSPRSPRLPPFGDTAVVSYAFSIAYELGTERHDERGREALVFNRREGSWKVVWRMQIPGTAESRPA